MVKNNSIVDDDRKELMRKRRAFLAKLIREKGNCSVEEFYLAYREYLLIAGVDFFMTTNQNLEIMVSSIFSSWREEYHLLERDGAAYVGSVVDWDDGCGHKGRISL